MPAIGASAVGSAQRDGAIRSTEIAASAADPCQPVAGSYSAMLGGSLLGVPSLNSTAGSKGSAVLLGVAP